MEVLTFLNAALAESNIAKAMKYSSGTKFAELRGMRAIVFMLTGMIQSR